MWPTLEFTFSHLFSSLNVHENFVNLFLWGYNLHMSSVSLLIPLLWAIQISPVTFSLIILSPVIVLPNCVERDGKNVIYCDCLILLATLKVAQQFLLQKLSSLFNTSLISWVIASSTFSSFVSNCLLDDVIVLKENHGQKVIAECWRLRCTVPAAGSDHLFKNRTHCVLCTNSIFFF